MTLNTCYRPVILSAVSHLMLASSNIDGILEGFDTLKGAQEVAKKCAGQNPGVPYYVYDRSTGWQCWVYMYYRDKLRIYREHTRELTDQEYREL